MVSPRPSSGGTSTWPATRRSRSEEHTSELQSQSNLVCRLLLEKKKKTKQDLNYSIAHPTTTSRYVASPLTLSEFAPTSRLQCSQRSLFQTDTSCHILRRTTMTP